MTFYQKVTEHLSKYKKDKFPNIPDGKWREYEKGYGYILPKNNLELNLLKYYRDKYLKSDLRNIKFHIYFNHLNSSQAMCINFFYPLYHEKRLNLIVDYIGLTDENIDYNSVRFEKESDIDGISNRRATNFDFYFETLSGKKFYFEIKYTEREFGKVKSDVEHIEKFNSIYKSKLKVINPAFRSQDIFFKHYQIIRNLIHINQNSYVVFLYPRNNTKIHDGVIDAKHNILSRTYTKNLWAIEWADLVDYVYRKNDLSEIKEQLDEFKVKYYF